MEAENFFELHNFEIDYQNDRKVSQRINIKSGKDGDAHIRTIFNEPYTADKAVYDVDIRYFAGSTGSEQYQLLINGKDVGDPWNSSDVDDQWKTYSISNVTINDGDTIMMKVYKEVGNEVKLDYIELNLK